MAALSSTTSSLSSINEESTHDDGVHHQRDEDDIPPNILPRRSSSLGSCSVSANTDDDGTVIRLHDGVEPLESIHEEAHNDLENLRSIISPVRTSTNTNRSGRGRRSRSSGNSRPDNNRSRVIEADEEKCEARSNSTQRRRQRSSSNNSSSSSRRSKQSSRDSSLRSESDRTKKSRRNSPKRPTLHHRRSRSTSDLQKEDHSNRTRPLSPHISGRPSRKLDLNKRTNNIEGSDDGSHQPDEKIKEMARMSNRSTRRSSRRSPPSSSDREDATNDDDELSKQTRVEDRRRHRPRSSSASSSSSGRHSHASSRRSLSAPRHHHPSDRSAISEADSSMQFSRNLDRRGAQHEFRRSTSSDGEDTASEASDDESRPGAYRVSSFATNRLLAANSLPKSSGHTFGVGENVVIVDSDSSHSESTSNTLFSSSQVAPASTTGNTMVTAEVARDRTDEIEAAREQGRAEVGLVVVHQANNVVAVVGQPPFGPKPDNGASWVSRKKKWLILFGLCFCFILLIGGIVGYFVLFGENENERNVLEGSSNQNDGGSTAHPEDNSGLDAVISFDPPSAEDCDSIANGTDVAGQEDMFTEFVDMHVQITTESEEEKAILVTLLKEQIQQNLIPRLVGCDDLEGNVIGNGVVDSVNNETSTCLFQSNPLCLEVVLTVKIYLRRKEDGSTVLDIMSELLLDEDLNEALELPPTVSVGIPVIVPSNFSTSVPTETPSWSPSLSNTAGNIVGSPSTMPNTISPSDEPTSWEMPTINMGNPTIEPTLQPAPKPTPPGPSSVPSASPVLDYQFDGETLLPVASAVPSLFPTESPSVTPTVSPSTSPSASPSLRPTNVPSRTPTVVPTASPTDAPSTPPTSTPSAPPTTSSPSNVPSFSPSTSPSVQPSELPTATFSPSGSPTTTPQPTVGGFFWVTCGKRNGCNSTLATVQYSNHVTIDGIPSILNGDMIAVRCCSDTYVEGFHGPRTESCPYVKSNIRGTCYNTETY